jgi:RimJ/RimL family protein N-acetyltransferase
VLPIPRQPLVEGDIALRSWREEDAPALTNICRDDAILRWTRAPANYGLDDALAYIGRSEDERRSGRGAYFAVVGAVDDQLLGACDLRLSPADPLVAEVGFLLGAHARGQGLAARAVCLLAQWGFDELGLARVELLTHPANYAAIAVAERAGFVREGLLRAYREKHGTRQDRVVFSRLATDPARAAAR